MKLFSFLFLLTVIVSAATTTCHYSCATCTGPAYTQCLSCSDSSLSVSNSVTCDGNDQNILGQMGGYCGSGAYSRANPLGVIIIFVAIVAGAFLKSQYVFSFILSLQTIGLIGLVQAAFPYGLSLLLGSCDYFMLFSIMGQNKKPQNCKLMLRNMYRLNDFLGTTSFRDNSLPILIVIFIVTALLVSVTLFRAFRKQTWTCLSAKVLDHIQFALRTFLLLTVQQAILIIYAGIRFSALNGGLIFIIILYCIALIYLVVDCNLHPLPYFRSYQLMNLAFIKRLMLPALAIVPYKFSYSLIIFYIGFSLIEILFLTKAPHAKAKNYIYAILELLCVALIGGFVIGDLGNNSSGQANGVGIFATLLLTVYIIIFAVQVIFGIKNRIAGSNGGVANSDQPWDAEVKSEKSNPVRDHDTIQDINNTHIENEGEFKVVPLDSATDQKIVPNLLQTSYKKERKFRVQ